MTLNLFILTFCLIVGLSAENYSLDNNFLHQLISRYNRPITFLGIGPDPTGCINQMSGKYQGVFVLLDSITPSTSFEPCFSNFMHLRRPYTLKLISHLVESEHFDFVYIWDEQFVKVYRYISSLGNCSENVLIKMVPFSNHIMKKLSSQGFSLIKLNDQSEELFLYKSNKVNFQKRTTWFEGKTNTPTAREIISSRDSKVLKKKYGVKPIISKWEPGINLITFKMMRGGIPFTETLSSEMTKILEIFHRDLMPNNIIVQGNKLTLIDFEDPNISENQFRTIITPEFKQLMSQFALEENEKNIPKMFEGILKYSQIVCNGAK
ncbi:MAG: hypothetical protein K9M07_05150 [Simkaniaceae bacterium]|nr:hypothetical protein [Simkaniaceae bacterium]